MAKSPEASPPASPKPATSPKATPAAKAATAPSPRLASPPSPRFIAVYRVVKGTAMIAGFLATMASLMALIGGLTESGYARVLGALFVTLAVPLVIGGRLLPENDPARGKGILGEAMAVTWVLFGFLFATVANGWTRGLLVNEGDRLRKDGAAAVAEVPYFLAGVHAVAPPPAPTPEPSASAATSGASSASAAPLVVTATASATAGASAAPSASASSKSEKPQKTPAELFKELAPSVVTIFVRGAVSEGGGTGFMIDKDGTIVTNHHVIDGAKNVKIKLFGGASYTDVELLTDDTKVDLAILRVDPTKPAEGAAVEFPVVALGDSDKIVVGERAVSIGNPLGLEHTLTDGLVSARRMYEGRAWIQMSVPVSPGNSGGPLFDMHGEVIGITTAQIGASGRAQNLNLAVPVNELKKLIKPEYPGRRKFGDASGKSQW